MPPIKTPQTQLPPAVRIKQILNAVEAGDGTYKEIAARIGLSVVRITALVTRVMNPDDYRTVMRAFEARREEVRGVEAWGECKTLLKWQRDPRAKVERSVIYNRIFKFGWTPEEAISTPAGSRRPSTVLPPIPAETLTELKALVRQGSKVRSMHGPGHPNRLAAVARSRLVRKLVDAGYQQKELAEALGTTKKVIHTYLYYLDPDEEETCSTTETSPGT